MTRRLDESASKFSTGPYRVAALCLVLVLVGSGARASDPAPAPAPPAPVAKEPSRPENLVASQRLMDIVSALPTRRAAFSDEAHKKGLRDTEAYLVRELKALGYEPQLEPIDFLGGDHDEPAWNNVYVDIPGSDPRFKSEWLFLGAHFDAVADAPGADDNGTGTAAVLEAARVLKNRPMKRSVRLIFFNLEEVGLVGSRAHAGRLQERVEKGELQIVGMVSLDMLGYFSTKPGSQKSPLPESKHFKPPNVGDFIGLAGILPHRTFSQALVKAMYQSAPGNEPAIARKGKGRDAQADRADRRPGMNPDHPDEPGVKIVAVDFLPIAPPDLLRSDHAPFLAINVPAVILSDTANFRSPHYHQPSDTIETLDRARFTATTRAVIGALYRLAGPGDEPNDPPVLAPPKVTDDENALTPTPANSEK